MASSPPTKTVIDISTGEAVEVPLTPEEIADQERAAAAGAHTAASAAFAVDEDAERLAVVQKRAAEDPAFAALADLTLGRKGVQT